MAPMQIDEEKLNSPDLKTLDIHHPPLKSAPHHEYPKMLYLHPVDKTKEHKTLVVKDKKEEDAALKKGWRAKPHIPEAAEPEINEDEYETK